MSADEKLARFALRHFDHASHSERADLLDAAAEYLPGDEAELCRVTARFIRISDEHQLMLTQLFSEKAS